MTRIRLITSYVSQEGVGATAQHEGADADLTLSDCGPTCLTMLIRTVTANKDIEVDEVTPLFPGGVVAINKNKGVTLANIRTVGNLPKFGLTFRYHTSQESQTHADQQQAQEALESALADRHPVIALVDYLRLPEANKGHPTFRQGHIIVLHGYDEQFYYYDDPYWRYGTTPPDAPKHPGENLAIPKQTLWHAMRGGRIAQLPWSYEMNILTSHQATEVAKPKESLIGKGIRGFSLHGTVRIGSGATTTPVANASVRLRGDARQLAFSKGAVTALPPGEGVWDQLVTGFDGDVVAAYRNGWVDPSLSYAGFVRNVAEHNQQLLASGYQMAADETYVFPRPYQAALWDRVEQGESLLATAKPDAIGKQGGMVGIGYALWDYEVRARGLDMAFDTFAETFRRLNELDDANIATLDPDRIYRMPAIVTGTWQRDWTRTLTGIEGTLDEVYNLYIAPDFPDLTRDEFRITARTLNSELVEDEDRFYRSKRYILPQRVARTYTYVATVTDDKGNYHLPFDLVGDYMLEVRAPDLPLLEMPLTLEGDTKQDVQLPKIVGGIIDKGTDVWVQRQGNRFILSNGTAFRFVGGNTKEILYWDHKYGIPGSEVDKHLQELKDALGGRVIRIFLPHNDFHDLHQRAEMWNRLKALLPKLEARDMYAIVAFTDVHSDSGYNLKRDKEKNFYNLLPTGSNVHFLNHAWYETDFRDHYLDFVEATVSEFANAPLTHRIMAWDIGNELRLLPEQGRTGQQARMANQAFFRTVAQRIRAIETSKRSDGRFHLITTGGINSINLSLGGDTDHSPIIAFYNSVPQIDFVTAHIYPDEPGSLETGRGDTEGQLAENIHQLNRPFVVEEYSVYHPQKRPDLHLSARVERMPSHLARFRALGADGVMQWGFGGIGDGRSAPEAYQLWIHNDDYQQVAKLYRDWLHG